jgi:transcriptional regulator with XRE-family HTH domain
MARSPRSRNETPRTRRARRGVKRQGLDLRKSYPTGEWYLMEPYRKVPAHTLPDLEAVEAWLSTKQGSHHQEPHWTHGAYIRSRRTALGLTQSQVARVARVTPSMVNRLEAGRRCGRPPLLRQVAAALGVPASELLQRAGYVAEARYWREQEAATEAPESMDRLRKAVRRLPRSPAVQEAVLTLAGALCREPAQAFRERFDAAAARGVDGAPTPEKVAVLRELIFGPEDAARPSDN